MTQVYFVCVWAGDGDWAAFCAKHGESLLAELARLDREDAGPVEPGGRPPPPADASLASRPAPR